VLVQLASGLQPPLFTAHSSTSVSQRTAAHTQRIAYVSYRCQKHRWTIIFFASKCWNIAHEFLYLFITVTVYALRCTVVYYLHYFIVRKCHIIYSFKSTLTKRKVKKNLRLKIISLIVSSQHSRCVYIIICVVDVFIKHSHNKAWFN